MSKTPFDVPRWGVFRANGEFCELKLADWESDPDAGKARWVGGDKDAELVRYVVATAQTELAAAKEKIAEQEAQIRALRKVVVCAEVALLDTAPCARTDCNQEQKPSYDIAIAAIDAARKK